MAVNPLYQAAVGTSIKKKNTAVLPQSGLTKGQPGNLATQPRISKGIPPAPGQLGTSPASGLTKGIPPAPGQLGTPAAPRPAAAPGAPTSPADAVVKPPVPSAPPPDPADELSKGNVLETYASATGKANRGISQAAFDYGDPSIMAQYGQGTVNPNSVLALAALKAQQDSQGLRGNELNANNYFSSVAQRNQGNVDAAQQRADLAGYTQYQRALAQFNAATTDAVNSRDFNIAQLNQDEATKAQANLPAAPTIGSSGVSVSQAGPAAPAPTSNATPKPAAKAPVKKPVAKGKSSSPLQAVKRK